MEGGGAIGQQGFIRLIPDSAFLVECLYDVERAGDVKFSPSRMDSPGDFDQATGRDGSRAAIIKL